MTAIATRQTATRRSGLPNYVFHESFADPRVSRLYEEPLESDAADYELKHMPDEKTREHAKRMHYSAWRAHTTEDAKERAKHLANYVKLRDAIVLGNRKLVYRAVRRRMSVAHRADDMIGECQIVLIQAVAAYNPWLGIRFSTYAYTCLVRALSRLSQRLASDWLSRSLPIELLPDSELRGGHRDEPSSSGTTRLEDYLRDDHPLLSAREKTILLRRFCLSEQTGLQTLEQVGKELGLSKERVRQVQASALDKLRQALLNPAS
jgi:RNA polymerase sigma factor (sigma-70 family)